MSGFAWFLLTIAAATVGGLVLQKLKFPAGAMVGAMIAVGALNIMTGGALMPASVKVFTRTIAGLFVGLSMNMDMVRNMKRLFKPLLLLVGVVFCLCLGAGTLLYHVTELDAVTALFCVAPGGLTDMALMTLDMGGDAAIVTVLQVMRLLSVYFISMPLAKFLGRRKGGFRHHSVGSTVEKRTLTAEEKRLGIRMVTITALVGGGIGLGFSQLLHFSVLTLIGAMVAAAAVNIKTGKLYMPGWVRRVAQILSGALIGTTVTRDSLVELRAVLIPAAILCCGFVCINIVLGLLLHKLCRLDMATAFLSSAVGGATEAALAAPDLDADPSVVSVLQISRMVCTTSFYPLLVQALYQFL